MSNVLYSLVSKQILFNCFVKQPYLNNLSLTKSIYLQHLLSKILNNSESMSTYDN